MSRPKDFLGNEINQGDLIVYTSRSGSSLNTVYAKVELCEEVPSETWRGEQSWKWKIQVTRLRDSFGEGNPKRKVTLNSFSHAVKVG